jgi:hypothetical protein
MRKIEERMVEAIQTGRSFSLANTRVTAIDKTGGSAVYLHGNLIATLKWKYHGLGILLRPSYTLELVQCTLAGWGTVTTRSRLNAICRGLDMACRFGQRKGQQYFDDQVIHEKQWVTL